MMPQGSNVDYIMGLTHRVDELTLQLRDFQRMFSALCLMQMDDKNRVRINKQVLNRVEKIDTAQWDTNARGAIIVDITMQD